MRHAPAQHQGRESTPHPGQLGIPLRLGVNPAIERIEHRRRRAPHLHGFGHVAEAIEKTAHRSLCGDPATLGAADAVGNRRNHVAPRLRQFRAENGAGEILVAFARSGVRGKAHAGLNAGKPLGHHRSQYGWSNMAGLNMTWSQCGLSRLSAKREAAAPSRAARQTFTTDRRISCRAGNGHRENCRRSPTRG